MNRKLAAHFSADGVTAKAAGRAASAPGTGPAGGIRLHADVSEADIAK
ncbi:MAG: hypothetical protein IJU46_04410 [Clostridia bacterium]|nr:hypothetical protein [Clostridia bacterium]